MPSTLGVVNSSNHDFTPAELKPYVWLDMSDESTLTFSSTPGAYIDGGLVLKVTSGIPNWARASNGSPVTISDLDIVCKAALANWNASDQELVNNGSSGFLRTAYGLRVHNGSAQFYTTDASFNTFYYSVALPSWSANSTHWLRVRRVQSSGLITFYQSDDGQTWTQIGSSQSGISGAIDSRWFGYLDIGQAYGFYSGVTGTIYKVQVWLGDLSSGGVKVFDADFESVRRHSLSFTENSTFRNSVAVTSSTNGRAVSAIAPKYSKYQETGARITNSQGLVLSGSSGNYAATPDSTSLDLTTALDIRCLITPQTWTPAFAQTFVSKGISSTDRAYSFRLTETGALDLIVRADAVVGTATSSVTVPFANGDTVWVRATWQSTGSVNFYTSIDGVSWTQLGTTRTTVTGTLTNSTGDLVVGFRQNVSSEFFEGTISRIVIKSSIDGTTVFDANFANQLSRTIQFSESSTNSALVTLTSTLNFVQNTTAAMPALGSDPKTGKIGLFFNGAHGIAAQNAADWKFMSDGTQFVVAVVWRVTQADANKLYGIIATSNDWSVNTIGFWIAVDDRTSQGSNNAMRAYIANNTAATVLDIPSANNAFLELETNVTSLVVKPLAALERGNMYINNSQVAVDTGNLQPPSSSNPVLPLTLGRISTGFLLPGVIHELIILSGDLANDTARTQLVKYLTDKYRTGLDDVADWLNGTYTSTATHHVVTFRTSGSFTPQKNLAVEYLVVGGGGAGGLADAAGGGGAGGAVTGSMTMSPRTYPVNIGSGGSSAGASGQDSFLGNREIIAYGGGGGSTSAPARSGGSGGGGNASFAFGAGTAGQGYNGGTGGGVPSTASGGGGGGAGSVGRDGSGLSQTAAGRGGDGIEWPTGSGIFYASGGGGGGSAGGGGGIITGIVPGGGGRGSTGATNGESGTANTGGGGGATRNATPGSGGSGIVIIRWLK